MNFKKIPSIYIKIIKFAVAIALITYLILQIDFNEFLTYFKQINWIILIPLFLFIPALLVASLRWKIILGKEISLFRVFNLSWISSFFSNFLPSTIAGDSYKIIKLRKEFGAVKLAESVFFDRLSGLIGLIISAALTSFIVYKLSHNLYLLTIPYLSLLLVFAGYFFILRVNLKIKFYTYVKTAILDFRKKIFYTTLLSIIYAFLGAISMWVYYLMFGESLNFFAVLALYSIVQIISFIPLSINALGLREGSMVYLFSLIGADPTLTFAIAIISRAVGIIQTAIGGIIYLFLKD